MNKDETGRREQRNSPGMLTERDNHATVLRYRLHQGERVLRAKRSERDHLKRILSDDAWIDIVRGLTVLTDHDFEAAVSAARIYRRLLRPPR